MTILTFHGSIEELFMLVYFIRHGEVENPEGIKYGRLPGFPLSEVGQDEIKKLSAELVDKNIAI